ncbi:hypothetical protein MLD38_024820 [Melastoma candidum]|nr:hypothetical protein MLD38_024820 [Melastoma candidum]
MQKEKDSLTNCTNDAIRQWAAVASSIAATESRECIDLFLQLDGLSFMNRWLLDADKFDDDMKDGFVEESINALLNAIVKLQLDSERSVSSGIFLTVENLLSHHSSKVRDKARALFDLWKPGEMGNPVDNGNAGNLADNNEQPYCATASIAPANEKGNAGNSAVDSTVNKTERPTDSAHLQPEKVEDEPVNGNDDEHPLQGKSNQVDAEDTPSDPLLSSCLSKPGCETRQDEDVHPAVLAEVPSGANIPNMEMHASVDGQEGLSEAKRSGEAERRADEAERRADEAENLITSLRPAENAASKAYESCRGEIPEETNLPTAAFGSSGVSNEINDDACVRPESEADGGKDDEMIVGTSGGTFKEAEDISRSSTSASHGRELNQRKLDDSRIFFSKIKYGGTDDEGKDPSRNRNERTDASVSYRLGMETSSRRVADRNRSNAELDYGIVDALEVARQVAQEVEREVVDYKERFCSSPSERDSGGRLGRAGSPVSIQERDSSSDSLSNKLPRQNSYSEASSEDNGSVLENQNAEAENSGHDMESSQVTEATQEQEDKTEKGLSAFDLNQEVCSEDVDRPEKMNSVPISVVSASKPAAASGVPASPLEFEGILGWKGSASTSAFRPASPRRKSAGDETVNVERTDSGRKLPSLNIDLNVAESGDDKIADLMPSVPIPISSSLRSGDSSLEVSSRRPEKLTLDLNRLGDDGEPSISDFRPGPPVFFHLNSRRSPSPASSSSSMQRGTRAFDLNDRPLTRIDFTEQRCRGSKFSLEPSLFGKAKQDPVISILGARVEVNKKDHASQTLALLNGNRGFETAVDATIMTTAGGFLGMGPGIPHQQQQQQPPPIWASNGLTPPPTVSFPPAVYRPGCSIPYMMDPRGAPLLHQAAGPVSSTPSSYPQAPPFMMSMNPGPFALNGPYPGPMRPPLDLNFGFSVGDGAGRESSTGLRQFFVPDHGRQTEELSMGGFPPSSSVPVVGTKRKEPDGGWEPYPFSCRQQQPPRK